MGFDLDFAEIQKQVEVNSRAGARLVTSEYQVKNILATKGKNAGQTFEITEWVMEWERLDRQLDFILKTRITVPRPEFINRRDPMYRILENFQGMQIRGKKPEDFIGVTCVIQEELDRRTNFPWWLPVAPYQEGQSIEDALASHEGREVDLSVNTNNSTPSEEVQVLDDNDEVLEFETNVLHLVKNKTHAQAIRALKASDTIKENEEWLEKVNDNDAITEVIESLVEGNYLTEVDNKYQLV